MQHSIMLSVFREAGLFNEQYILARHDAKGAIPSSWLRRESLKRLAYFAFRLDIYFYFLRGYRPMLRYDEFCLTLPCSERLWEAQTAEEWHKVKLIESRKRNPMYFTHLVDQAMDQNCRATLPPLLEDEYLYGLCAMQAWLWQDAQRHRSRTESAGVRSNLQSKTPASFSRSSEFWTKQLTLWKEGYRDRVLGPELSSKGHRETLEISAIPLYHLSQIVLAANVETLKELATDSRLRPYSGTFRRQLESSTLRWVQTPDARLAVWHAAKILKLLRDKFCQQDTQGNNPSSTIPHIGLIASIALYEAGLVVWAYARSVQVCDACSMGSSLQAASDSLESFELFGMEQDEPFRHWLEHGGRELMDGRSVCACNLSSLVGLYEAVLLRCGSQWRCVSQMAQSLSQLKQGD
ncbi:hypothetical protein ASPVEDRAFT_219967 [Aspergillus versicolor CBS 583.65]|uniref:Xylanolytic transcriptional activator regulatory domain-containing protein n=1 Tax=Aspergillus versicolor CBS 583.65 TaxID=1036611 RepID=A0A1L9P3N0_ASPVE|nr:uncharacterized protein ASPVEDRAFT_219967 [Aspergillus versicolor CBS 583.65]OJI96137.1 hypothetical protein ASPVEDRAFT_219967 [Aspergillus versicolor CBS 583.65]